MIKPEVDRAVARATVLGPSHRRPEDEPRPRPMPTDVLAASVAAEVAKLGTLDLRQLREVWRQWLGPAPTLRSPELLRLHLAWRLQAEAFGGLDTQTRQRLRGRLGQRSAADQLAMGAKLVREWEGVLHEVTVADGGFEYAGQRFKSLSEIARQITGSRWNGPRFFGLREKPTTERR